MSYVYLLAAIVCEVFATTFLKAANGFTDVYDGKRYKPVTDDNMYTEPISGYIEKQ